MHQPFYQDLATGEHILPWVRLHALKDYWGMVALLHEFPSVRVTFNLVPSLLVQLESFASERAHEAHLEIGLKPADRLSGEDRRFCLEHYFRAHRPRMIEPYPRYAELLAQRERSRGEPGGGASSFSVDDFRDLQVWHKLVWLDPIYLERDTRARVLMEKGRGFTEDDKLALRSLELELLRRVVPEYRSAAERGQVELSTSPFYHPILPLLCDSDVHLTAHPGSRTPRERFRHPEDAVEQVNRAITFHEALFGRRPAGVWPSEGSVSDAVVSLLAGAGFTWMATDEGILARTLNRGFSRSADGHLEQPEVLYHPYRVGPPGHSVACGFRDQALSDLIGFSYASWSAETAAEDFVQRLEEAGRRYSKRTGEEATVFVILDGENAWEHYDGQGRPFLRALYGRLAGHPALQTVTMSEACAGASEPLPSIFPGSWINSDFYVWIGHPDDHRAWSQLGDARRSLERAASAVAPESLTQAREELLIAEGSDWFWWYGDDRSSENDLEFDELFRSHVRNAYRALGESVPEELFVTNITTQPLTEIVLEPTGLIGPTVDGEVTSYFEWIGAGRVDRATAAGAMTRGGGVDTIAVEFGCGPDALFIRVDGSRAMRDVLGGERYLTVDFLTPRGLQLLVTRNADGAHAVLRSRGADGAWSPTLATGLQAAVSTIVELKVPFPVLTVDAGTVVAFTVSLNQGASRVDQRPANRAIELQLGGVPPSPAS
jgi:alpha-amylase/alpha-mannosidase (GH57 family)